MAVFSKKNFSILGWLYLAMLLALSFYVVFFTDFSDIFKGYPEEHYQTLNKGWLDENGQEVDLTKIALKDSAVKLRIVNTLPQYIKNGESLNICSHNLFFNVYIDGVRVYDYAPEKNLTGYGTGDVYHSITLTPQDRGKNIEIEIALLFAGENGGRLSNMLICDASTFNYLIFKDKGLDSILSEIIIFLGVIIFILHFVVRKENQNGYDLIALSGTVILIGTWTLIESNIPQILLDMTVALRVMDYLFLPLMIYPLIRFINSILKKKNTIYQRLAFIVMASAISAVMIARFGFDIDMHRSIGYFLVSYVFTIVLIGFMLIKNHIYCKEKGIPEGLKHFYIGASCLLVGGLIDVIDYVVHAKAKNNNGNFLRLGLIIFIFSMFIQILIWLLRERRTTRRESFVNSMMQYAISGESAESMITHILEYMGRELHPQHLYIYERQEDSTFKNTYYWSEKEGIKRNGALTPITDLEIVEDFINPQFRESGSVVIKNRKQCKESSPKLFALLEEMDVNGLILVPIRIGEDYLGFMGMMDPPVDNMDEITGIMKVLEFFISETIRRRGVERNLINYSYYDPVTGVKNRRALEEFEANVLDTSQPYGYIMCDINGLKTVNDTEGHEAGDVLIKDVADSLSLAYGQDNVYRMGGDEFAAYSVLKDKKEFDDCFVKLNQELKKRKRSASLGYVYKPDGDPDYERVKKEADRMMYEDKRKYYSDGHDRRMG